MSNSQMASNMPWSATEQSWMKDPKTFQRSVVKILLKRKIHRRYLSQLAISWDMQKKEWSLDLSSSKIAQQLKYANFNRSYHIKMFPIEYKMTFEQFSIFLHFRSVSLQSDSFQEDEIYQYRCCVKTRQDRYFLYLVTENFYICVVVYILNAYLCKGGWGWSSPSGGWCSPRVIFNIPDLGCNSTNSVLTRSDLILLIV